MPVFPSEEWVSQYIEKINQSREYEDAARKWEGDFTFIILKDEKLPQTANLYLDLFHGKCRSGKLSFGDSAPKSEFIYSGPYRNWIRLLNGELDPIQSILTGKFKLKGPMMKIMRYTRAAKALVNTANQVETEFK